MPHPAQYSPEVLDVLAELIRPGERVHDPMSGPGLRLGSLCDRLGAIFSGADIEDWPGHDARVRVADARDPSSYPAEPFTVATSPTYQNKRLADYPNGPTPHTKVKGRRDYAISLGRALRPDNLARTTGRPRLAHLYWKGHAEAVKHWGDRVLLNVDQPIADGWCGLLDDAGYLIEAAIPAYTRRYGGLDNADKRAAYEVVVVAVRE
jgi:hypothetical protein